MSWENRVRFSLEDRFAYVPDQVLVLGLGDDGVRAAIDGLGLEQAGDTRVVGRTSLRLFRGAGDDVPLLVRELRARGATAQPNHVLFADAGCGCCPPHPASIGCGGARGNPVWANPVWANPVWANPVWANPVWANPVWANPVWANPVWANPVWANPVWANPVWANPVWASAGDLEAFRMTGERRSTAIPAEAPAGWIVQPPAQGSVPRVVVLDTGYPSRPASGSQPDHRPHFVPARLGSFDADLPDVPLAGVAAKDGYLDPVAGHGAFIAGLIDRVQPGCEIEVRKIVQPEGDVDELTLVDALEQLAAAKAGPDLVNLSLSGYAFDDMVALRFAVAHLQRRGTILVASAGNDGTCRPAYPASLPGVVGVGAIGPDGPAPFTNYGPWVRACAPGVDLVSTFFKEFDGKQAAPAGAADPDRFDGWARWSGTSFSAPIVVGAIARAMVSYSIPTPDAARRVIEAPGLMRIPNLGTVVNIW